MKLFFTVLFLLTLTKPSNAQICCDDWLQLKNRFAAITVGDLDVAGNKITVEAMFNMTGPSVDIVSKHYGAYDVNYLLRPIRAEITTENGYFSTDQGTCVLQLNKTYHAALVYDGSTLKFYRNGFLISQVAASGNLVTNNWNTAIGEHAPVVTPTINGAPNPGYNNPNPPYYDESFRGFINEVRIWKVARTQAQIKAYMNKPLPNPSGQVGLLGYWSFNNLVNKQGNATYNGCIKGLAKISKTNTSCTFIADSCCNPDTNPTGCNDWLQLKNRFAAVTVGDLDVTGNKMTVEAMFNMTGPSVDIVSKHKGANDVNYLLRPVRGEISTENGFFYTSTDEGTCVLQQNKVYHAALVYDGSTLKFYRNGFLISEVPASGNLITNNWNTAIGEHAPVVTPTLDGAPNPGYNNQNTDEGYYDESFKGFINEVRIWNVARTQDQIKANMNKSLPNPSAQVGLLGYWVFNTLSNKQGNVAYNGFIEGLATINQTNTSCTFTADACGAGIQPARITDKVFALDFYPNPSRDMINVRFNDFSGNANITLLNNAGHVLVRKKATVTPGSIVSFDLKKYEKGTYFINVLTPNKKVSKRIMHL